ncbi:hypothetical protein [Ilumatobacter sp.]|uniref:hypothetical protein n=1 Tax=Ilumatobacter sp. TaxID=1967498 RepID=UPI003B5231BE
MSDTSTEPSDRTPDRADALVMFGLTGDLGEKKLFPALYDLTAAGRLGVPVIGVGRSEHTDSDLRDMLDSSLDGYSPADGSDLDPDVVSSIDLSYLSGDSTEPSTYDELAERLGDVRLPVVYAALPPGIFGDVARGIDASSLPDTTRLVVEKPFGSDATSARELHDEITAELDGSRLFIVDHFLAKSAIENMLVVRSSNPLIENSMCASFVESIELEMRESGGVDGRGSFYESVGAIDDVLQNHLLQMLAVLMMEAPDDPSDEAYHRSRSALLASLSPFDPARTVLGQYEGYRELDDVDDDSEVETFVATTTTVDDDRWGGVPITVRTGKRLDDDLTRATITLRTGTAQGERITNRIRFGVKPGTSVEFDIGVLDPDTHDTTPASIVASGPADHGALGDYAIMLDNAMSGATRHFAQIDDVVSAWRIVEEIKSADLERRPYAIGSSGPDGAADL